MGEKNLRYEIFSKAIMRHWRCPPATKDKGLQARKDTI